MKNNPSCFPGTNRRGFTLVELLAVLAIIVTLSALSITAIQGISKSDSFDGSMSQIVGILDQARSYAVAQNTYVWVAFYPLDPSQLTGSAKDVSGDQLFVATFASSAGNNPFTWGSQTSYSIPYPDSVTGTTIFQVNKIRSFKQLRVWPQGGNSGNYYNITSLPSSTQPTAPATTPIFAVPSPVASQFTLSTQPVPSTGQGAIAVVEFSPSGSAFAGANLSLSIGLDFQPMKSATVANSSNQATIRINGPTGLTTLYRQ